MNQEREKRRLRRNHLNNIDEMIEIIDNIGIPNDPKEILKRATSYSRIKCNQSFKSVVSNDSNHTRMRSISPKSQLVQNSEISNQIREYRILEQQKDPKTINRKFSSYDFFLRLSNSVKILTSSLLKNNFIH